ncbi:MAG: OmpA family protein [Rickettsiales bacterium]|nr:OmpA family protein [Rickettsiales bacterium]
MILSSCFSKYYQQDEGNFYNYLRNNYSTYASYKTENYDWKGARIFNSKAKKIEEGKIVLPIDLPTEKQMTKFFSKNITPTQFEDMQQRMFLVINNETAKKEYPEEVASLQFYHDCWIVEEEYYTKYSQIARCKQGFIDTLAYLEFKLMLLTKEERDLILNDLDKDDYEPQVFVKPRKYVIGFDFDSSVINEHANRVIWEVLEDVKKIDGNYIINIKGHADRVGNRKYNEKLSKRRTLTVRHYLVKNGINDLKIKENWDGEIDPRVITNNDFKEKLNRRVVITIDRLE